MDIGGRGGILRYVAVAVYRVVMVVVVMVVVVVVVVDIVVEYV